jgi:hypothetical protein
MKIVLKSWKKWSKPEEKISKDDIERINLYFELIEKISCSGLFGHLVCCQVDDEWEKSTKNWTWVQHEENNEIIQESMTSNCFDSIMEVRGESRHLRSSGCQSILQIRSPKREKLKCRSRMMLNSELQSRNAMVSLALGLFPSVTASSIRTR